MTIFFQHFQPCTGDLISLKIFFFRPVQIFTLIRRFYKISTVQIIIHLFACRFVNGLEKGTTVVPVKLATDCWTTEKLVSVSLLLQSVIV